MLKIHSMTRKPVLLCCNSPSFGSAWPNMENLHHENSRCWSMNRMETTFLLRNAVIVIYCTEILSETMYRILNTVFPKHFCQPYDFMVVQWLSVCVTQFWRCDPFVHLIISTVRKRISENEDKFWFRVKRKAESIPTSPFYSKDSINHIMNRAKCTDISIEWQIQAFIFLPSSFNTSESLAELATDLPNSYMFLSTSVTERFSTESNVILSSAKEEMGRFSLKIARKILLHSPHT